MNSRNDYRHFIIIRVARFIHRQRYVKCICILCIEIMAVIELPIMGRFVKHYGQEHKRQTEKRAADNK